MTLGLAPGNCAFTTTVGGTTSGYSEIGSWNTVTHPPEDEERDHSGKDRPVDEESGQIHGVDSNGARNF